MVENVFPMRSQRLISCLMLLQGKRRSTAAELARRLGVSTRTIYRDVDALCEAGVPLHAERGSLGGIVLADDYRRALAQFTNDELLALFASGPSPMGDLGIAAQGDALQKLAGALPAGQRRAAESGRARVFVDQHRWSRAEQPKALLVRLREAASADRRVRLRYRDRGGSESERVLDPLGLVAKAGVWYLVAREEGKGYRTFRAERIVAVDLLTTPFVRPSDFDLEAYWNASVSSLEKRNRESYVVVADVAREAVVTLTSFWETTIVAERAEGSTVRVAFPSRDTAIVQMLVLADAVDIRTPETLAVEIVARARSAIARFAPRPRARRGVASERRAKTPRRAR